MYSVKRLLEISSSRGVVRANRRHQRQAAAVWATLFDRQAAFWHDPSKRKAMRCGRRAGKTSGAARGMLAKALEHPMTNQIVVELSRTSQSAKTFMRAVESEAKRFKIAIRVNRTEDYYELENQSRIYIMGAADRKEADKIRGVERLLLAWIDEPAAFRPSILGYLMDEVITPALADLDGTLVLSGTPGAACTGAFFEISGVGRPTWSVHHWTMRENPYMPHADAWLRNLRKENNWTESHPIYRREYLGEWVRDISSLVYPYDPSKNACDQLPDSIREWFYVLGLDIGHVHSTAWVVWAYSPMSPIAFCVESGKRSGMVPSDVAEHVRMLDARYQFERKVADTGGIGLGYTAEMATRHGVAMSTADKRKKRYTIDFFAGAMLGAQCKWITEANLEYIEEMSILQWDEKHEMPDERYEDHLCDGGIYGYKCTPHFKYEMPVPEPSGPYDRFAAEADADFDSFFDD